MANLFNVHCMLCGRHAGQVRNGTFQRLATAPPLRQRGGKSRCGFCGGSLFLEAEDSPFARDLTTFSPIPAPVPTTRRAGQRRAS
jgi:hypothetical protein